MPGAVPGPGVVEVTVPASIVLAGLEKLRGSPNVVPKAEWGQSGEGERPRAWLGGQTLVSQLHKHRRLPQEVLSYGAHRLALRACQLSLNKA